ncbi:MAG: hypothetical protein P1U38_00075 [Aeromicrobium sp.]|uniref:hypothetical protein n=1 Tax=Aeromicrobium sp. TaxID=1871063 RepID=UPI0025C60DA4|nr:hypothetical protein [Aeromicrobium sp.]MCK5890879.1 hypothetical protein [Aeromicrobium sp.]MDF1703148.1 hypothetical protein [Aeromicrobium sp.]
MSDHVTAKTQADRLTRAMESFDGSVIRVCGDTVSIAGIEPCGRTVADIVRQIAADDVLGEVAILDIGIRNTVEGLGAVRLATTNGLSERAVRLVDDLLAARERLVAATHASDLDLGVRVHVGRAGVRPAR